MPSNIPRMRALMDDPLFRAYMKQTPKLHAVNRTGDPWQVWVDQGNGRWGTTLRSTYADAWKVFVHHFRAGDGRDVTLVSRRLFYAPPGEWYRVRVRVPVTLKHPQGFRVDTRWRQKFFWPETDLAWCGRCRRPSYWMPLFSNHHALRRQPAVAEEDNIRCIICGIRWIAMPSIEQMTKLEVQ